MKESQYVRDLNRAQLQSVATNGISSTDSISVIVNHSIGRQDVTGSVCVNYITPPRESLLDKVLDVAMFEEYTGIFPIVMERGVPFFSDLSEGRMAELQERLLNNVVIITKNPNLEMGDNRVFAYTDSTYNIKSNTVTTLHDGSLPSRQPEHQYVVEIKTEKRFTPQSIVAIWTPENILPLAQEVFKGSDWAKKLVAVETNAYFTIRRPSKLLEIVSNDSSFPTGRYQIPDYQSLLHKQLQSKRAITLHALRLHTSYDLRPMFIPRSITTAEKTKFQLLDYPNYKHVYLAHATSLINVSHFLKKTGLDQRHALSSYRHYDRRERLLACKNGARTLRTVYNEQDTPYIDIIKHSNIPTFTFMNYQYLFLTQYHAAKVQTLFQRIDLRTVAKYVEAAGTRIMKFLSHQYRRKSIQALMDLKRQEAQLTLEQNKLLKELGRIQSAKKTIICHVRKAEDRLRASARRLPKIGE